MLLQAPHISTPSGNAPLLADVIVPLALSGTFTYLVPPALAGEVRQVLDVNKQERHIRGGMATREKYLHMAHQ